MKKIRTILGDIEREKLGFTYTHEHLIAVPPAHQKDRDLELNDYYKSYSELLKFKEAGKSNLLVKIYPGADHRLDASGTSHRSDFFEELGHLLQGP